MITQYKIFTMPNCDKCADMKEELNKTLLKGTVVDAGEDEGVMEIRKIYPKIRDKIERTEGGSMPFPTVLLMDDSQEIIAVINKPEQLKENLS